MKIQEFRKLIREEVRRVIAENTAPIEAQDFAIAAKKKFKDALLGVDYIKGYNSTLVTAHVDIKKWKLADKYWANKYTKTLGNNKFKFRTEAQPTTFTKDDMYGTEVK